MKLKAEDEEKKAVPWYVLNAKQSIEQIHEEIKQVTHNVFKDINSNDIRPLWK